MALRGGEVDETPVGEQVQRSPVGEGERLDHGAGLAALDIPRFLGAFFALVGALGLIHALVTSTRRRRPLFAVWRSVGFTPGQVRRSVLWQGILVTGAGLLIGLPVGLVVGRLAFARVIDDLGVIDTPSTPTLLLVLTVPVALGLALVVAALPAWSAARGPAARFLRTE